LEKGNHQSDKASDRYHIKECCHLSNDTNSKINWAKTNARRASFDYQFFLSPPCCMILAYSPSYFASRLAE
jgi:hypothetical protein